MADSFRYDAFISYRHRKPDVDWADWLVRGLETYTPPRGLRKALEAQGRPARVARVFRDLDETAAGGDLNRLLKEALEQSRTLIVVCTRNTPGSPWVNQEVEYFESLGRAAHVLPLLVEGEPSEAFPPALLDHTAADAHIGAPAAAESASLEPLAADVRPIAGTAPREVRRRARLKLVAGVLGIRYDDLYQRDARRRRIRAAFVAACVAVVAAGATSWWAWTRTDAYQVRAVLRDAPALIGDAVDDDAAAWVQALAYSGRSDDAIRAAEATAGFAGGQVKAMLALADVFAEQGDTARAASMTQRALEGISQFQPPFRAELSEYAVARLEARGDRDGAATFATAALTDTASISDAAARVSAVEKLAHRLVGLGRTQVAADDAVTQAILRMESARAATRAGPPAAADELVRESFLAARRAEPAEVRAYLEAYLCGAAADTGVAVPPATLRTVVAASLALSTDVARSQAIRMTIQALSRAGKLEEARSLLREITIQEDRDAAIEGLIGTYARAGRAGDVGQLLAIGAGRDDVDQYSLLTAAAEGAADGGQQAILPLLDQHGPANQRLELRVIVAERLRTLKRDPNEALTVALRAALDAGASTDTGEQRSRLITQLAAAGRVAEATMLVETLTDSHDRAFGWIALARQALDRKAGSETVRLLAAAEAAEREVKDQELVAAGLREIAVLRRDAGDLAGATALLLEASTRAASLGEAGSSTTADVLVELAQAGALRVARVTADRACTAGDRLRVYAAILNPKAQGRALTIAAPAAP